MGSNLISGGQTTYRSEFMILHAVIHQLQILFKFFSILQGSKSASHTYVSTLARSHGKAPPQFFPCNYINPKSTEPWLLWKKKMLTQHIKQTCPNKETKAVNSAKKKKKIVCKYTWEKPVLYTSQDSHSHTYLLTIKWILVLMCRHMTPCMDSHTQRSAHHPEVSQKWLPWNGLVLP